MLRRAFTLIELLVVIAIVALLLGILVPALGAARARARAAVCSSHLHQMSLATTLYLDEHKQVFWPYYTDVTGGRKWWFGFEAGGPGSGTKRPLDKTQAALAPYISTTSDLFQCPDFPYNDPNYFPKFAQRSASLGFNLTLANQRLDKFSPSAVFVFADGIHFDANPGFNEGHYIQYTPNTAMKSGYAHFRHQGQAQYALLDGHVDRQRLSGPAYTTIGGGAAGNLGTPEAPTAVYGLP